MFSTLFYTILHILILKQGNRLMAPSVVKSYNRLNLWNFHFHFRSHFYIASFELIALFWFDLWKFNLIAAMFVNGFFKRHNSSRALITREKELALWREWARTTTKSDWPSGAHTHLNLRQRAQAKGRKRSQGRVARNAARQICRRREKEGLRKCAKGNDFFRRFAQGGAAW